MDWLKSVHFYRKVPADLTEATLAGGTLSLLSAIAMAYLFFSNFAAFLQEQPMPTASHSHPGSRVRHRRLTPTPLPELDV